MAHGALAWRPGDVVKPTAFVGVEPECCAYVESVRPGLHEPRGCHGTDAHRRSGPWDACPRRGVGKGGKLVGEVVALELNSWSGRPGALHVCSAVRAVCFPAAGNGSEELVRGPNRERRHHIASSGRDGRPGGQASTRGPVSRACGRSREIGEYLTVRHGILRRLWWEASGAPDHFRDWQSLMTVSSYSGSSLASK